MWKTVLAGATALAVVGSSLVYAQQRPGGPEGPRAMPQQQTTEDANAFTEARIAALHAGLMLTPDQEKNWPAFEQAYRDFAKLRRELRDARRNEARTDNPIDRMQHEADALTRRGAALKRLADAAAPLYQSLDDAQKRRALLLARPMMGMGQFDSRRGHHMGPGMGGMMGGRGMGGMMGGGMGPRMGWADRDEQSGFGWRRGHGMGHDEQDWRGRHGPRGMGPQMGQDERL